MEYDNKVEIILESPMPKKKTEKIKITPAIIRKIEKELAKIDSTMTEDDRNKMMHCQHPAFVERGGGTAQCLSCSAKLSPMGVAVASARKVEKMWEFAQRLAGIPEVFVDKLKKGTLSKLDQRRLAYHLDHVNATLHRTIYIGQ